MRLSKKTQKAMERAEKEVRSKVLKSGKRVKTGNSEPREIGYGAIQVPAQGGFRFGTAQDRFRQNPQSRTAGRRMGRPSGWIIMSVP